MVLTRAMTQSSSTAAQTTTPTKKPRRCNKFHLFAHLPPELRCMIWDFAARKQQLVVTVLAAERRDKKVLFGLECRNSQALSRRDGLVALDHTCKEAHDQFRRTTRKVAMCNGSGYRTADPEQDIFYMRFQDYQNINTAAWPWFQAVSRPKWTIRNLMIDMGGLWTTHKPAAQVAEASASLQELYLFDMHWDQPRTLNQDKLRRRWLLIDHVRRRRAAKGSMRRQCKISARRDGHRGDIHMHSFPEHVRMWVAHSKCYPRTKGRGWPAA